nr:MAG TPA: hypothetical protein [Caudoviricetes sp.]
MLRLLYFSKRVGVFLLFGNLGLFLLGFVIS